MSLRCCQRNGSSSLQRVAWFCCALAPACVYPTQVLTGTTMAAAIQYAAILAVVALVLIEQRHSFPVSTRLGRVRIGFGPIVCAYAASFAIHCVSEIVAKQWSSYVFARNVVVFASPLVVYFAARRASSGSSILAGLATAGIANGALWVVEAAHRAVSGDVSEFAIRAFDYASVRMEEVQGSEQTNFNRINPASRVYGVQEFARISASWWSLGIAAMASYLAESGRTRRATAALAAGLLVLIACQSFTAVIAFSIATWVAFQGPSAKRAAVWLAVALPILLMSLALTLAVAIAAPADISSAIDNGARRGRVLELHHSAQVTRDCSYAAPIKRRAHTPTIEKFQSPDSAT